MRQHGQQYMYIFGVKNEVRKIGRKKLPVVASIRDSILLR
jgi:hypothetical protein